MSLPDQVMLDSPAQTPEAKNPQQSMLRGGGHSSSNMATTMGEVGMMIEDESLGANNSDFSGGAVGSWDNKQWRDELTVVTNKLQHKNFNPSQYRDPMSKPLIAKPAGLTAELEQRLRKCYWEATQGKQ